MAPCLRVPQPEPPYRVIRLRGLSNMAIVRSGMDRGAHYVKADLQVHSPRDPQFKARSVSDEDRRQYAREFVAACRARGLGAVAITDHHDFAFVPFIREAATGELDGTGAPLPRNRQLVVFPGLELSLEIPCQALLIFSADFPTDRLAAVLDKLGIEPTPDGEDRARDPTALQFGSFVELYKRLDETSWLRGQYAVLPNVTDKGYATLLRSRMQAKYRDMPSVRRLSGRPRISDRQRQSTYPRWAGSELGEQANRRHSDVGRSVSRRARIERYVDQVGRTYRRGAAPGMPGQ